MRKIVLAATLIPLIVAGCRKHETPNKPAAQQTQTAAQTETTARSVPPPATPATDADTAVGTPMPDFKAELLDGKQFDIASERGNVVFLNLWATWCGPCRQEIPELEKMHNDYAARGFKVVGVSLDEGGKDTVQQFVSEQKMTYPIALDPDGKLANVFQTTVIPTSVLIDRKGKIIWKRYGQVAFDDELKQAVENALKS